jgi:probable dihydroxyacetone kinase regulator
MGHMPDSSITKKALGTALKEMMSQRPLAKISVGEICKECNMNRKSFYYHFKDKYDLVNWVYHTEFIEDIQTKTYADGWDFLLDICEYFERNRSFYTNALQVTGQNSFLDYFAQFIRPIIGSYCEEAFETDEQQCFYATLFTDAFEAAIFRWLTEDTKISAYEFVELIKAVSVFSAKKVLTNLPADENQ